MKTILAAVNFSEASHNATMYAAGLCRSYGSILVLFHAYHIPVVNSTSGEISSLKILKDGIELKMKNLVKELKSKFKNIDRQQIIDQGFAAETIEEKAKEKKANLIVMGISSQTDSLSDRIIDNVSMRMAKTSRIPVLIVPQHLKFKKIKKIVFACDLNRTLGIDTVLPKIKQFHNLFKSGLEMLNVIKPKDIFTIEKNRITSHIEEELSITSRNTLFIYDNNTDAGLLEYIKNYHVDMIIMCPKKHNFLHELFIASTTKKIASHTSIPVLMVNS